MERVAMNVSDAETAPTAVRRVILEKLRRDLVGPGQSDEDIATELLRERPGRWYLTGHLVPAPDTKVELSEPDLTALDLGDPADGVDPATGNARPDDDGDTDPGATRRVYLPSSLGLTVQVPLSATHLTVALTWGDYTTEPPMDVLQLQDTTLGGTPPNWRRHPREASQIVRIPDRGRGEPVTVPDSAALGQAGGGLQLELLARPYDVPQPDGTTVPTRVVTIMVINRRPALQHRAADLTTAFQVCMTVSCDQGLLPRADLSSVADGDFDRRLADLQYRDVVEYAVGLNCSAGWPEGQAVNKAWTEPLPLAQVLRVAPNEDIGGVTWGMEALTQAAASPDTLGAALANLPDAYEVWITGQENAIGLIPGASRQVTARELIKRMREVKQRIAEGITLLTTDARARRAFAAMNTAVARAARRRFAGPDGRPEDVSAPTWRPFQLAFILMNLAGLTIRTHKDRDVVDLLFFPTGGGKTEAYLGLAAYTIANRRLSAGGPLGAGVTVLMRYTLRLLTLDQLSRAAGVVCALELMRQEPAWQENGKPLLGTWPIEIGLWVGSDASPNKLGKKGNADDRTAVVRVRRFKQTGKVAPAPIKACPWCGTPFDQQSFACMPTDVAPKNMEIRCANVACEFTGDRALPVLTVDEAIYRRLPAFLIATVDKFASLPWLGEAGAFFGHVDRMDEWGFYGPSDRPSDGTKLWGGGSLAPPDLIVQDELHLISGPLGTVAGLYEAVLDRLSTRIESGVPVRPKIVASTATVRRAEAQVRALFCRDKTQVFPSPGPDRNDSFFAITHKPERSPARWYLGVAAQGKGPKLIFLRVLTTLLSAAMAELNKEGGAADPYMTAVCYFNALRELGGARRIVEDEVRSRLREYGTKRRRLDPPDAPFADRRLPEETGILELTSRVSTDQVAEAKARLDQACDGVGSGADVALATNMISVGLDITRLGLMVVQGQPKTAAEYIQATSRVGRDATRPGLVVTVLNVHKPRDRMHYERFPQFHECFYRAVEATSVTPWAARALDRALAAVVVSLARHLVPDMTHQVAVARLSQHPQLRDEVKRTMVSRVPQGAVVGGIGELEKAIDTLMDNWLNVAAEQTAMSGTFAYGQATHALLHDPLDPALPNLTPAHQVFKATWSMRDVEAAVPLDIRQPNGAMLSLPRGTP